MLGSNTACVKKSVFSWLPMRDFDLHEIIYKPFVPVLHDGGAPWYNMRTLEHQNRMQSFFNVKYRHVFPALTSQSKNYLDLRQTWVYRPLVIVTDWTPADISVRLDTDLASLIP